MIEIQGLERLYSDSRVGWKTVPMWSIATRKDRKGYAEAELLSVYRAFGVIRKSDRDDNHNVESEDLSSYKFVKKGDLVLNKMKTWQGSLGVSKFEGIVSPAYFVCELSPNVHGPYIHFLLRSEPYIAMYAAASKGIRVGQWDLPYEEFRDIPVLLPPIEEQRRIADYLEHETSKVAQIIEYKEKLLIALANEFASFVDEQMHFATDKIKLKYQFQISNGNSISAEYIDLNRLAEVTGLPFIATKELGFDGKINYETDLRIPLHLEEHFRIANPGVVFICAEGGSAGKKFGMNYERVCFGNKLFAISSKANIEAEFLYFIFWSSEFQSQFRVSMNGMIGGVSSGALGEIRIPLCDGESQSTITALLSKKYEHLRGAIHQIEQSSRLLDEHIRSLTTAAVTGQFDVTTGRSVA